MNTFKLTTLTMLIPLGWAVSVDAYPDPFKEIGPARDSLPEVTCGITSSNLELQKRARQNPNHFPSELDALFRQHDLFRHPEPRDLPTDTCGLDLDQIDLN